MPSWLQVSSGGVPCCGCEFNIRCNGKQTFSYKGVIVTSNAQDCIFRQISRRRAPPKLLALAKLEQEENHMTKFILRWAVNAIALYLAVLLLPGIDLRSNLVSILWLALIFGLINALFRPLIQLLTCPLIVLTLGLFTLVINTFLFWLTSVIGQSFGFGLIISDPVWWNAFLGGLVISLVSIVMTMILKDELKGRRKF